VLVTIYVLLAIIGIIYRTLNWSLC